MKKILLNGCSFVAGDDIAWDYESNGPWPGNNLEKSEFYKNNIRPQKNLKGQLNTRLSTDVYDLSEDGNNNTKIALTTYGFLERQLAAEKKDIHVCIGWTERSRQSLWSKSNNTFVTVNFAMLEHNKKLAKTQKWSENVTNDFENWLTPYLINNHEVNDILKDLMIIFFLENFLKSQGITYTFWNALNHPVNLNYINEAEKYFNLNLMNLTDRKMWLTQKTSYIDHPYFDQPWMTHLRRDPKNNLTPTLHPSQLAVSELVDMLIEKMSL